MLEQATALLALWNDVAPEHEDAYNAWHADEHVPERCTVPGILWGLRYAQAEAQPSAMPRYLTLYGLRDAAVLDSAPYQRLLREPTPASHAMRPSLRHLSRWVCRLHACAALHMQPRLRVHTCDARPDPGTVAMLLGERLVDAPALPWLQSGQGQAIAGSWLVCSAADADAGPGLLFERLSVGDIQA